MNTDNEQACSCDEATPPSTAEEINAAIDRVVELAKRYPGRLALAAIVDSEGNLRRTSLVTEATYLSDKRNTEVFSWVGACGYLMQADKCFSRDMRVVSEGCRIFLEEQERRSKKEQEDHLKGVLKKSFCNGENED